MIYISVLIFLFVNARVLGTWVDPFSIDFKENDDVSSCESRNNNVENDFVITHYQRSLNLMLNILRHDEESDLYSGRLHITLSSEDYNFLKDFSKLHADNPNKWRKIDDILGGIYNKSVFDKSFDYITDLQERIFLFFFRKEILIIFALLLLILFIYSLFLQKFKLGVVISYLAFIFFVIDFSFTWIRLLQEKDVEKLLNIQRQESLPPYCDPSQMSSYDWFKYKLFSSHKECENFYKSQYLDDFWIVSPLKVIAVQFSNFIETPAESLGNALGKLFNSILANTSWYHMPFIPFIMVFIIALIGIILSLVTRTSFGFNFLHIMQFHFGKSTKDNVPDKEQHISIHVNNRPQIEDIKITKSDTENKQFQIQDVKMDEEISIKDTKLLEISPDKMDKENIVEENDIQEISQSLNDAAKKMC